MPGRIAQLILDVSLEASAGKKKVLQEDWQFSEMSIKYILAEGQHSKGHLFGKLPRAQSRMEAEKRRERGHGDALQRGLGRTKRLVSPRNSMKNNWHEVIHLLTSPPPHMVTVTWRNWGLTAGEDTAWTSGGLLCSGGIRRMYPCPMILRRWGWGWSSRAPRLWNEGEKSRSSLHHWPPSLQSGPWGEGVQRHGGGETGGRNRISETAVVVQLRGQGPSRRTAEVRMAEQTAEQRSQPLCSALSALTRSLNAEGTENTHHSDITQVIKCGGYWKHASLRYHTGP